MNLIKQGFKLLLLTGCFHFYILFPELKFSLIILGYILGILILRKGFFKNGATFLNKNKDE